MTCLRLQEDEDFFGEEVSGMSPLSGLAPSPMGKEEVDAAISRYTTV